MTPPINSVMTVTGPIEASALGNTLMHEHILNDCSCWWNKPANTDRDYLANAEVNIQILSELRQDPFVCKHNLALDNEALAVDELSEFKSSGGNTVVDPTCRGIGRNPEALVRIAQKTGLNIVMGSGYYLQSSHPAELKSMSVEEVAAQIVYEAHEGISTGSDSQTENIRIGLIGEIGVSSDFTAEERKSLQGAARAQVQTGLPLMVHLPGWFRLGNEVLDVVENEGVDPRRVVLCHMNPSHFDRDYQLQLAQRGAFIEYDMIGMDYFYADQQVQCPSDEDAASGIITLAEQGHLDKVLLSQDVFLKMMLTRYGGNGYAYIQRHFLPRLQRHGLNDADLIQLTHQNPRCVFDPEFKLKQGVIV
ncbi:MAG: phosphotriesterase [Granulosicoccus sp.]